MSIPISKAVLLAAGRGTRMRNLTNELPKPMIAVRDKPILQHIIEGLSGAGVRQFFNTPPKSCRTGRAEWWSWRATSPGAILSS